MRPELVSYNYDQRVWAPDLKRRVDLMQLTDTKNSHDPIAAHAHPLVIPIFWPTKRRWEGQCICVCVCVWGYWKVTHWVASTAAAATRNSRNQNPAFPQHIFSIFPMASQSWFCKVRKMFKKEAPEHSRQVYVQRLRLGTMLICLFMDTHTHKMIPGLLTNTTGSEKRLDRNCSHPTILTVITSLNWINFTHAHRPGLKWKRVLR